MASLLDWTVGCAAAALPSATGSSVPWLGPLTAAVSEELAFADTMTVTKSVGGSVGCLEFSSVLLKARSSPTSRALSRTRGQEFKT
jgi:hypothetical protein